MGSYIDRDAKVLDERWQWIGVSHMRSRTRRVGKRNKLIVDVWELTGHRTSKARALRFARDSVSKFAVSGVDHTVLLDFESDKKVSTADGSQTVVHVRQSSFAFQGV